MNRAPFRAIGCAAFVLLLSACSAEVRPVAEAGYLSAVDWNPAVDGRIDLRGEWGFYWNEFIDPDAPPPADTFLYQPTLWNTVEVGGETLPPLGYASFRLQVDLSDNWPEILGVRVMEISTAFRLYINGVLVSQAGTPAELPEHASGRLVPQTNTFQRQGADTLDIVLHVSNHIDREGGRRRAIYLGSADDILKLEHRRIALEALLTGALLLIGIYHLILFAFRKKEPLPLAFAVVCIVFALRGAFEGERLILMVLDMPFSLYGKLWFILYFVLAPAVAWFLQFLFPDDTKRRITQASLVAMTIFSVATLIAPLQTGIFLLPFYHVVTLSIMVYSVWVIVLAVYRHRPGAFVFAGGVAVLIVTGLNDILYSENIIDSTYLAPAGLLAFVLSQAYFIAARFSGALSRVQRLSAQLKSYSLELEDKVSIRTRELQHRNNEIMESIEYAKLIQSSVLPTAENIQKVVPQSFVIWKPRDIVGGDFYWSHKTDTGGWIAVGDCTGHGVPGALMAMMAVSLLNREAHLLNPAQPEAFLHHLNSAVRTALQREGRSRGFDDGFDLLLAHFDGKVLRGAGAHLGIFHLQQKTPQFYSGGRHSIGYMKRASSVQYQRVEIALAPGDSVFLMSDGLLDQSGGPKGFSFGRRRFLDLLATLSTQPFESYQSAIENALTEYAAGRPQRDDIVVLGFQA